MHDFDQNNEKGRSDEFEPAPWWVERLMGRMDDLERKVERNERTLRRKGLISAGIRACLKSANDNKVFWVIALGIIANALGVEIDWNALAAALGA